MDRSPLHMLSFVIAFVPLRLLAAANNLLIHYYGTAPLGRLVGLVSRQTSPAAGFWLVMGTVFYLLGFASGPAAARLIIWLRTRPYDPKTQISLPLISALSKGRLSASDPGFRL